MASTVLSIAIALPLLSPFLLYPIGRKFKKAAGLLSTIVLAASAVMLFSAVPTFLNDRKPIYEEYSWISVLNITFGFRLDGLSLPIAVIIALLSTLTAIYSLEYMKESEGQSGYYANLLLFYAGMEGVVLATDLLELYFFWELMIIPSYFLILFWGTPEKAPRVGFKYFIYTHVGSLFLLLGILLTYNYTHTFSLLTLQTVLKDTSVPAIMLKLIVIFMMIGFMVKMAVFPFYTWLPDAHSEAPTPISALLSGVMIKCGAYAIVRIVAICFAETFTDLSLALAVIGVATMIYGGLLAIIQTDVKRLLAYSSISQMGYIFFAFSVYTQLGYVGGLFHIITHALGKGLLFMVAGIIIHQTGLREIKKLGGLASKMPITAVAATIGALSLAGSPPFCGFFSEFFIFYGGLTAGGQLTILTGFALISTIITAVYYLLFIWRVFLGSTPDHLKDVKEASPLMWIPIVTLATITIILGVNPGLLTNVLTQVATQITGS